MQFTVLIEFLVPGVATILLVLAFLPGGAVPELPINLGDAVAALLLLAIAYPVGILLNIPLFWVQRGWLLPRARRKIFKEYESELRDLVTEEPKDDSKAISTAALRRAFGRLHASVFARNIDRLNAHSYFHQSLQRLARGIAIPLALAIAWIVGRQNPGWVVVVGLLAILIGLSFWLLCYSLHADEERVAVYYLQLTSGNRSDGPDEKDLSTVARDSSDR